uniref:Uncharacterized protein n=1 Tax=Arundo donax TaxID=35708 RepID=A0A0A9DFZ8_ARUDO
MNVDKKNCLACVSSQTHALASACLRFLHYHCHKSWSLAHETGNSRTRSAAQHLQLRSDSPGLC